MIFALIVLHSVLILFYSAGRNHHAKGLKIFSWLDELSFRLSAS